MSKQSTRRTGERAGAAKPADPASRPATASASSEVSLAVTREVHDTCLCFAAQRAARTLARRFDAALRPIGINNGQYSLMMALNGLGAAPLGEIARVLAMDRTTLTAKLKPLQARGLVDIGTDPNDRRGRQLKLSKQGRRVLARAVPLWRATHGDIDRELGGTSLELRARLWRIATP